MTEKRASVFTFVLVSGFTGLLVAQLSWSTAHAQTPYNPWTPGNGGFNNPSPVPTTPEAEEPVKGADAVEFEPVPLDTSVACSSVILKGTRRFQGTAFALPRVLISVNKQQEQLFEILRLADGRYLLRFAIYFPRTDEDIELRTNNGTMTLEGCNYDEVVHELNRNIKDNNKRIHTISRVPISSVDVKIDGVQEAFTLGGGDSSMFNFQGGDHVVEYSFASRKDLDAVLARIDGLGLPIHVRMKFNARAANGSMSVVIDLSKLAASLGASLAGRKVITAGELQALMGTELQKMSLDIQTESGSGTVYQTIVAQLMQFVLAAAMADGDIPYNPTYGQPTYGTQPFGFGNSPVIGGDPNNPGGAGQPTGPNQPPPTPGLETGQVLKVAGVIKALHAQKEKRITYENVGRSQQQTYSTSVRFKGELQDPDVRTFNISTDETQGRLVPNRLSKGQPLTIAAISVNPEVIEWKPRTRFFTLKQLSQFKIYDYFPLLRDERLSINDKSLHNGLVAVMKKSPQWSPFNDEFFVWGAQELYASYHAGTRQELAPTAAALNDIPVVVSFSRVGARKFPLSYLVNTNSMWAGAFDDVGGKIVLTPNADLGQMTLWNTQAQRTEFKERRFLFQERRNSHGTLEVQRAAIDKAELPVTRGTVRLQLSVGSDLGEVIGVVQPSPGGNGSVIIPGAN